MAARRRLLRLLLLCGLLVQTGLVPLLQGAATAASASSVPTLAASPSTIAPLQPLTVTGTAFGPGDGIAVYWDLTGTTPLSTTTAGSDGSFVAHAFAPQASAGRHSLLALDQSSGLTATVPLTITPATTLRAARGGARSRNVLSGVGFGAGETVTAYWEPGNVVLGRATTSVSGTVAGASGITVTVPLSATGSYAVYAVGSTSKAVAHSAFTLTPPAALTAAPTTATPLQSLAVTGTNFGPSEPVVLYWDRTSTPPLTSTTTSAAGAFVAHLTVPQAISGTHTLIAVGVSSTLYALASVHVKPALFLSASHGLPGTAVAVSGVGFGASETVSAYWAPGNLPLGSAQSSGVGTFAGASALTVTVPLSAAGSYAIYAVGASSKAAALAPFTLNAAPATVTPTSVATIASTNTPLPTVTVTLTPTVSPTATAPLSATNTPLPATNTPTTAPTVTPTLTPTLTDTPLPTVTNTPIPFDPSPTPSFTPDPTDTFTPIPTTPAPTLTPIPTLPPTNTPTPACTTTLPSSITVNTELTTSPCSTYTSSGTTVQSGATLTVDPGVTLTFAKNGYLSVKGALVATGTASQPITLTSAAASPKPGDWVGLIVGANATSTLSYATINDAGLACCNGVDAAVYVAGSAALDNVTVANSGDGGLDAACCTAHLSLTNSTVASSAGRGLYVKSSAAAPVVQNDTFTDNAGSAIELVNPGAMGSLSNNTFSGNGFDGVYLDGGSLTTSTTWPGTSGSIKLAGTITVATGVTLTVAPGTTVLATNGSGLTVNGNLTTTGTASQPVLFTSAASSPAPGDWCGLAFKSASSGSLSYTTIADAGNNIFDGSCSPSYNSSESTAFYAAVNLAGGTVSLDHSTVTASASDGIDAETSCYIICGPAPGSILSVSNSTVSFNHQAGISVDATSAATVTASTIASNSGIGVMTWSAASRLQNDTFASNGSDAVELTDPTATAQFASNTFAGNGFDGVYLAGPSLNASATWSPAADGLIKLGEEVTVAGGATLTVASGTTVLAATGSGLTVNGNLTAAGTASQPVLFTSAASSPAPGDWCGLAFKSASSGSLSYTTIADAGNNIFDGSCSPSYNSSESTAFYAAVNLAGGTVSLDHSTVTASASDGIDAETSCFYGCGPTPGSALSVSNSTVSFNHQAGISVDATSAATVTASTIASNSGIGVMTWSAASRLQNDTFTGNGSDAVEVTNPTATAQFSNNAFAGNGWDGVYLAGPSLNASATWSPAADGLIKLGGEMTVAKGVTLTVAAGTTVLASTGSGLTINGNLVASGTASQPILFTSAASSPAPGDWCGLAFKSASSGSLSYTTIADAGNNIFDGSCSPSYNSSESTAFYAAVNLAGGTVSLDHSTVTASASDGIDAETSCYIICGPAPGSILSVSNSSITHVSTAVSVDSSSTASIHGSTISDDAFGISFCCASQSAQAVQAQNNYWGTPSGPAPYGSGPGISQHQECQLNPITYQCTYFTVDDVAVFPWTDEGIVLGPVNGPGGGGGGGAAGSSSSGGGADGSYNDNTVSVAEPVNSATGSYEYSHSDLSLGGRTPLVFSRSYNSDTAAASPGPLGYGWTFSYGISLTTSMSGSTPLVLVTFGSGRTDVFSQQSDGSYSAAPGQFDTLTVNADGSYDVADLQQTDYHFSAFGVLLSIADRNGNLTSLSYNASNQLTTVSAAGGRSLTFTYDGSGHISTVADNIGRTVTFGYSPAGDLTSVTDPRGNTTYYAYDGGHQLVTGVDRNNHTFVSNSYDSPDAGRVISQTNALGYTTTFQYFPASGVTLVTDPRGATTTYTYDASFNLVTVQDAQGGTSSYTYDAQGNRLSATDPDTHTWHYSYDAHGNVLTKTDPLGNTTMTSYDAGNQPTSILDPLQNLTTFSYDSHENLQSSTDPLGNTTTYSYDAQGDLLSTTDPLSHTTTYGYDAAGDAISVTNALGHSTLTAYDGAGRPTSVTDALGHTTSTSYDANGDVLSVTDALSHTTNSTYDGEGNRLSVTDPRNNTTYYLYDAANELSQVTDAAGGVTTYSYDGDGNRSGVTDARGHSTTTSYDPLNRVKAVTNPLSQTVSYTYDAAGNRTSSVNARGHSTRYSYDAANHLTGIAYADGTSVSYGYNADGLRNLLVDGTGTTSYSYDADNHLSSVAQPGGTVGYTYDAAGNRSSVTVPSGKTTRYGYDAADELTSVTDWRSHVLSTTYDAAGRTSAMTYTGGLSAAYSYDAANHVLGISYQSGSTALGSFGYSYDADGNRLTETDGSGTTSYSYDALNRLTSAQAPGGTTSYGYDAVGNRTAMTTTAGTTSYSYDAADELTAAGALSYSYDADGNRIGATNGVSSTSYSYDDANYLTGLTSGAQTVSYTYNGDHDRVGSTVNGATTSELLDLAASLPTVLQQVTAGSTTTYLYGTGLLAQDNGTSEQFLLPDALGSTRLVANPDGSLAGVASYDAYGNQTTSGTSSAFGFTGQQADAESGLLYLRARYYDPATGVFLQRDPFPADSFNPVTLDRYVYVNDNPTNLTDPSGRITPADAAIGCGVGAAGGLLETGVSSLFGEKHYWEDYVGAAVGGCVGGAVATFNPFAGGAAGAVTAKAVQDGLTSVFEPERAKSDCIDWSSAQYQEQYIGVAFEGAATGIFDTLGKAASDSPALTKFLGEQAENLVTLPASVIQGEFDTASKAYGFNPETWASWL